MAEIKHCPKCLRKLVFSHVSVYCSGCRKWFCLNDPRIAESTFRPRKLVIEQLALFEEKNNHNLQGVNRNGRF